MGGGESGRSAAAACRTRRKIKGASAVIDQVKIGLHLRLSLRRCLFVCIDKSCDLADRTLCLLSIQRRGGGRGGGEEEEGGTTLCSKVNLFLRNAGKPFHVLDKPDEKSSAVSHKPGKLEHDGENCHLIQRQEEVTNQTGANLSTLTASERAAPVLQGHQLSRDF